MPRPPMQQRLKFKQPLTKGVPSGELLKRLQTLHKELAPLDQDLIDTSSLDAVKKELVSPSLLQAKDKGVKALTACCIADLLRLYAPDAPYTEAQLTTVFQFFIRQLKNLTGPSCANYQEYLYLLESLANVKSAVLMCDIPGADQLVSETYKVFFDLARPDLPKNVIAYLADILSQIVEESATVPQSVVDTLLVQYLPKNTTGNPTALSLAVDVFTATSDKLQRYIAHYFTEVITNAVEGGSSEDEEDEGISSDEPSEDDDDDGADGSRKRKRKAAGAKGKAASSNKKPASSNKGKGKAGPTSMAESSDYIVAHDLIKSINRFCPPVLANVIPQLEEELLAEDAGIRAIAARTLGEMFSDAHSGKTSANPTVGTLLAHLGAIQPVRADLAKKYPSAWRNFVARSRDKLPAIRLLVLEAFRDILPNHPELGLEIYAAVKAKLVDPDEKVRATTCALFQKTDYEMALHGFDKELLLILAARMQDKKAPVRKEALHSLSRLYNHAFGSIANGDEAAVERFGWIPTEILKAGLILDREVYTECEKAIHDYILPLPAKVEDEPLWVDRLLIVMQHLDETATKALIRTTRLLEKRPLIYERFIDACEDYNGGTMDTDQEGKTARFKAVSRIVAMQYADPTRAGMDLHKFATKLNDSKTYKSLRKLMDPSSDLKTIIRHHADALKRIETASSSIAETMNVFVRRSGFLIINRSCIPHLVKKVQKASGGGREATPSSENGDSQERNGGEVDEQTMVTGRNAYRMLEIIAKHCPQLYKSYLPDLAKTLVEERDERLVQLALQAFGNVALADPSAFQRDSTVLEAAYKLALDGTPSQAKHAATFIARVPENQEQTLELVKELADTLPASSGSRLLSHLNALKRLAKYSHEAFAAKENGLFSVLLSQLSGKKGVTQRKAEADDSMELDVKPELGNGVFDDWCTDEDFLPEHQACILALKVLTNYVLSQAENAEFTKSASFFRVLEAILASNGHPRNFKSGPGLAGRLRLQAAVSLLKLGQAVRYEAQVLKQLEQLAWVLQDATFQVRGLLTRKLVAYIHARRLPSYKFTTLLFITAHDPDPENLMMARKCVTDRYHAASPEQRVHDFDFLIVRLLHLLAHHPDFGQDADDLKVSAKYIEFFADCIITKENVSLVHYLIQKLKMVRDATSSGHSQNLYVLSELAQHVVRARAELNGWTLTSHPTTLKMPTDIFKPLPSREVALEIRNTAYISPETIEQLGAVGKPVKTDLKKVRQVKPASSTSAPASGASKKRKSSPKPKKEPSRKASNGNAKANGSAKKAAKPKADKWRSDDDEEDEDEDADETSDADSLEEALHAHEYGSDLEEGHAEGQSEAGNGAEESDEAGGAAAPTAKSRSQQAKEASEKSNGKQNGSEGTRRSSRRAAKDDEADENDMKTVA